MAENKSAAEAALYPITSASKPNLISSGRPASLGRQKLQNIKEVPGP
jgi:hypothetical protein